MMSPSRRVRPPSISIIPSYSVAGSEPRSQHSQPPRSASSASRYRLRQPVIPFEHLRRADTAPFADYAPSLAHGHLEDGDSDQWAEALYDDYQEDSEGYSLRSGDIHQPISRSLRLSPSNTSLSSTSSSQSRSRRRAFRSPSRGFVGKLKDTVSQLRPSSSTPSLTIYYQSDRSISPPSSAPTSLDVQPIPPPSSKNNEDHPESPLALDGLYKLRRRLAAHAHMPTVQAPISSPHRARQEVLLLLPSDSPLARGATTAYARKERKLFAGVRQRGHVFKSCENDEVYASWRTRTPLGYRFSLHRGCAEGPIVMQATTAPFKRFTFGLQRIPTPAVSASVGASESGQLRNGDSLGWTGTLRKTDYYGQRWGFKLPKRQAVPLARLSERPLTASRFRPETNAGSPAAQVGSPGAHDGRNVSSHITTFAVGQVDGGREFEWTGAHVMHLVEKNSGSLRPLATFIRDVTDPKGAGELRYDIDFPDVEVMIITLLTLLDWHSRSVPTSVE